jgi:hypothetical protein
MEDICNRRESNSNINTSMADLLDICNTRMERFIGKIQDSGLSLSGRDKSNLYLGAEMMVYCYRDKERNAEKAYAFEHPLDMNDILLDAYNSIYIGKEGGKPVVHQIVPSHEFISCFRNHYLDMFHDNFFHDTIELGISTADFIRRFYEGLGMNGKSTAKNVISMTVPKGAPEEVIRKKLDALKDNPVTKYSKSSDIMDNSGTKGSERQYMKMTSTHNEFMKEVVPFLYPYFFENIRKNYHADMVRYYNEKESNIVSPGRMPVRLLSHRPLIAGRRELSGILN